MNEIYQDIIIRLVACLSAISLNAAIVFWAVQPSYSDVKIPRQQIIEIVMVAPSILETQPVNEPQIVTIIEPQPVKIVKDKVKFHSKINKVKPKIKKLVDKELVNKQAQQQRITTGAVQEDAKAIHSAITKPIAASYLNNPPPIYPLKAKKKNQQGTVLLEVLVKINGRPKNIHIVKSSGYNILDNAAIQTVRLWQFIPAKHGSKTLEASVEVPIKFYLE